MSLSQTGYLDFSWPTITSVDGYLFKAYKNNTLLQTFDTASTAYRVSGLKEGDTVRGTVYPYKSDNVYVTGISLDSQSIPVTNFNLIGQNFSFQNLKINSKPVSFTNSSSGYYGTGTYEDGSAFINLELINPRDTGVLTNFSSEPFLSGVTHNIYANDASVLSRTLPSLNFQIKNTYDSRDIESELIVTDYYGSGITGNISLTNEAIAINYLSLFTTQKTDGSIDVNVIPKYSKLARKVESVVFTDDLLTGYIASGEFSTVNNFLINLPLDTTGILRVTPYDWFGTGHTFQYSKELYYSSDEYLDLKLNKIQNARLNINQNSGIVNFYSQIVNNSDSGSFFEFSVDNNQTGSFDGDSYLTGSANQLDTGVSFDFFNERTGIHTDFFFNLNLYRSGTRLLEDSIQLSGSILYPHFTSSGIEFHYGLGETEIITHSEPEYTFSGVDILVSGDGDTSFNIYSGNSYTNQELSSEVKFKIVHASDHSNEFDSLGFNYSGLQPNISLRRSTFSDPDGFQSLEIVTNGLPDELFSSFEIFQKKTFKKVSDIIPSGLSGILEFNDYANHKIKTVYSAGINQISAPSSINRNQQYDATGYYFTGSPPSSVFFTGTYESGRHYSYRVVPVNGYGSGLASNSATLQFPINAFTNFIDTSLETAEQEIDTLNTGTVRISGSQTILGEKTFENNIIITGSGYYIFASDPTGLDHVATKNYVDESYDSIRTTYSQMNTGTDLITGSPLYLSNILMSGYIFIDNISGDYNPTSFFYPIECTGLKFEKVGQASYYTV